MPWIDDDPVLNRRFEVPEFVSASADLQVESLVYVQVDATPAYGLLEAEWAAQQERVGAVVAYAPLEDGSVARSYLDALAKIPAVRGVRRLIQSEAADFPLRLIEGLKLLPSYRLSFDICIRHHQLPSTIEMVRACPDVSFILDHLGKPDISAHLLDPWREQLAQLAALPNVVCKISGAVTEADHTSWTPSDLQPYISHALEVFGEDRVLFGGDWPVVTLAASYQRWVETLTELTQGLSEQAADKLWRQNARRVYGL